MKKPILVANWKNRPGSLPEAQALLKEFGRKKALYKKVHLFIAPPFAYFESVAKIVRSFGKLASQDLSPFERGTHTGAITVEILKSFGTQLAILGHSERRSLGESSQEVAQKAKTALRAGITPLICVGEKLRDAEGEHFEFLREEIKISLSSLNKKEAGEIILAYEPIWAIGKTAKDAIVPADLTQTVLFIKKVLSDLFGRSIAEGIPLLYGGSVEPENAREHMITGVRGFLVGHASLESENLAAIAETLTTKS